MAPLTTATEEPVDATVARTKIRMAPTTVEKNFENTLFELEASDLELLESRVGELERYLGIENMDLAYFNQNEGEDLNKKAQVLEDFLRVAEDKYFCINELFGRFEKMDTFLKHERPFVEQCMDLKQKTSFITDWVEELQTFISQIEGIRQKEKYVGFEPIVGK